MLVDAFPAVWIEVYQWRCPQGGSTGCSAGELHLLQ